MYQIPWIYWISDPFKETPLLNFNGDFDGGSDVTCKETFRIGVGIGVGQYELIITHDT